MYDVIVIGAGVGGYTAAIKAAKAGMKTAIIESAEIGGTCLNRGCIPTKYLISEVHKYYDLRERLSNGLYEGTISFDYKRMVDYLKDKVATLTNGIQWLLEKNGADIYKGTAEFVDAEHIQVNEAKELLTAKKVIIASGSYPQTMSVYGNAQEICKQVYTTDNIFENLDDVPQSLSIIGSGAVGLEFAFIYAGLGTKVTLIEQRNSLFEDVDHDIEIELTRRLSDSGIRCIRGCHIDSIFSDSSGVTIIDENEDEIIKTDIILFAMGRKANFENLHLQKAGILIENGVVWTDDNYRTSNPNIYAVGDVNGKKTLAYAATAQAENVIVDICNKGRKKEEKIIPSCYFLNPEIAFVGMLEKEAQRKNICIKTSKYLMNSNGRSRVDNNGGFIKFIVDKNSEVILGGICVCYMASELISYITIAIETKMTLTQFAQTVFPHPTYSESLVEAAELINKDCVYML